MRMASFVGFVFYAVLILVGREAALVQGRAVPVPVTKYRTSVPLFWDGNLRVNGSYVPSEQGLCSVVNVSEAGVQVSQAYQCRASSQPPLLLDDDEATTTWNATEYAARCYNFSAGKELFIALFVPQNWCISTLNLTFYADTQNKISLPSNVTLQSSNTSAYGEESDHKFTQFTHDLTDNRAVLTFELAHNVCDLYFQIKLSGCRVQTCTRYYLCEVDAFQIRSDLSNGNTTTSSQGFFPWYVQLFRGENLVYVFIALSVLVTGIILLYICSTTVCCVVCCKKCSRRARPNPAEKYVAFEFLPGDGEAVVLTGSNKKDECSTSIEADTSDSSIVMPDTSSDMHSVSLNLHALPIVRCLASADQEKGPGNEKKLPTSATTADEHECSPATRHQNDYCQLQRNSAYGASKQMVKEPQALCEPDQSRLLSVHPLPHAARTASGSPIVVPVAADGYAYLNAVHTTAEGYSYIQTMHGLEHTPLKTERSLSYGGQLSTKLPSYANHEIITLQTGTVQYGEKEYAEIVIPEDPTKEDPVLSLEASSA